MYTADLAHEAPFPRSPDEASGRVLPVPVGQKVVLEGYIPGGEWDTGMLEALRRYGHFIRSGSLRPAHYRAIHQFMLKVDQGIPIRDTIVYVDKMMRFIERYRSQMGRRRVSSVSPSLPSPEKKSPVHIAPDSDPRLSSLTSHHASMSQRRLSANMPVLQRHLSFNKYTNGSPSGFLVPGSLSLFQGDQCSTPITPLDKIIHTPLQPPEIQRVEPRKVSAPWSKIPTWSPVESVTHRSPILCSSISKMSVSSSAEGPSRRVSVITPPSTVLQRRVPRRLSYSHNAGWATSPLSHRRTAVHHEAFANLAADPLASPLTIRSSSVTPQADKSHCTDHYFTPAVASPRSTLVA